MFDVGFTELVLLFVIGLLILGPERLPRVATQLGRWMGKARRTAHQLRMQLEREMTMNDIMRDQKEREQRDAAAGATSAAKSEDAESDDAGSDARYPEEEDANDSGHADAGADDDTSETARTPAAGDDTAKNDNDAPQQRHA
jgi:sec-independent protein translocase protein TatB